MTFRDAYSQRWHDFVSIVSRSQAQGLIPIEEDAESLVQVPAVALTLYLLSWYGRGDF